SVSLIVPGAAEPADTSGPPPVTGKYKLTHGGKIYLQLMKGKKYTTTISPMNPNRFDLIDSDTEGLATHDRVAAVRPAARDAAPATAGCARRGGSAADGVGPRPGAWACRARGGSAARK